MEGDTYKLLQRMISAAQSSDELEMVLRRFLEIIRAKRCSKASADAFDVAWAMTCAAQVYLRLNEAFLAEQMYVEAIEQFAKNKMTALSAELCIVLAHLFVEQGRMSQAEALLEHSAHYIASYWGKGHYYVSLAQEELHHFRQTGEMIRATQHIWCKPCGVDRFGVGFNEDSNQRKEKIDSWRQ